MMSASGDPFIASLVLDLFKKYWYDEVDSFYVCYNNYAEMRKEIQGEFLERYADDPKIKIVYWPTALGYGLPINKMLGISTEDLILLLEDDGFIFTPGVVDSAFKQIENNHVDALGSPRFSCGQEIAEALRLRYNLDYSGYGDKGPNFWPNFFFCKREDLLKTDLNFAPKEFTVGINYPELDHTMESTEAGDTFVWSCIQMRHAGVRFGEVPQYHCSPFELDEFAKKEGNWRNAAGPFWLHGGSLSVGASKYLKGVIPDVSNESAKLEIETRCAWWIIALRAANGFESYVEEYEKGIEELVEKAPLDKERVLAKVELYKRCLNI